MKKLLLSLFWIITLWLVNFWSCWTVSDLITIIHSESNISINAGSMYSLFSNFYSSNVWTYCVKINSFSSNDDFLQLWTSYHNNWSFDLNNTQFININSNDSPTMTCFFFQYWNIVVKNSSSSVSNFSYDIFKLSDLLAENLPIMTSLECQTEYNLIPISSVDSNYCEINWLCPACPVCPELSWWLSNFYIYSDWRYVHLSWTYNYYVNIPDYLDYSYDYSNWWDDLDLDIWVSVDTWYISSVKWVQGSIPNQVDLNNIITWVLPLFVPWLCIILLLYFIFRFVKKVF